MSYHTHAFAFHAVRTVSSRVSPAWFVTALGDSGGSAARTRHRRLGPSSPPRIDLEVSRRRQGTRHRNYTSRSSSCVPRRATWQHQFTSCRRRRRRGHFFQLESRIPKVGRIRWFSGDGRRQRFYAAKRHLLGPRRYPLLFTAGLSTPDGPGRQPILRTLWSLIKGWPAFDAATLRRTHGPGRRNLRMQMVLRADLMSAQTSGRGIT